VIGVYALNETLDIASYAIHGPWTHVGAPGGEPMGPGRGILIPVTDNTGASTGTGGGTFGWFAGSSFSSPEVAGVIALMRSVQPDLTRAAAIQIIDSTAIDLGPPGFDDRFAYGMVDARAAVEAAANYIPPAQRVEAIPPSLHFEGTTTSLASTIRSFPPSPMTVGAVTATTADGGAWLTARMTATETPATVTVEVDPNLPDGRFQGTVVVATGLGPASIAVDVVRTHVVVPDKVIVSAVDATGRRVARVTTDAAKGYAFTLEDLPPGDYHVEAMVDRDGSLAVDRVDEFEDGSGGVIGTGPLVITPESLDVTDVVLAMDRHDARFSRIGTDGGPVAGAIAVLAVDARTGLPVAGARMHIGTGTGAPAAVTDSRGRAVATGDIAGAQTVTVVADGYWPSTHAGTDAQYFGVALEPIAPPAIRHVAVTVHGLAPGDRDVVVRMGDAVAYAIHADADPVLGLDVTDLGVRSAVVASASDADGIPTKFALLDVGDPAPALDLTVVPCAARSRLVGADLPAGMDVSSAKLDGVTFARPAIGWVELAASPLVLGDYRDARWPLPGTMSAPLLTRLEVRATDAAGRRSVGMLHATTSVGSWPAQLVILDPPASLVAPADGSPSVDRPVRLEWSSASAKPLRHIVMTRTDADGRWDVWVGGTATQVDIPGRDELMPASSTWRWTVEEFGAPSLDDASYDQAQFDATLTVRTLSASSTFTTR
jgi:subtilase family protein